VRRVKSEFRTLSSIPMINIFYQRRLRQLRRFFALTQTELSKLLGLRSKDTIAKLEAGTRSPSSDLLHKLTVVFDRPIEFFIPKDVERGLEVVAKNTKKMRAEFEEKKDAKSKRKVELLDAIMSRMAVNQHKSKKYDLDVNRGQDQRH
jgi:transcriptional regulator with XRE-family HTH domain